jgi:hypothetical protein
VGCWGSWRLSRSARARHRAGVVSGGAYGVSVLKQLLSVEPIPLVTLPSDGGTFMDHVAGTHVLNLVVSGSITVDVNGAVSGSDADAPPRCRFSTCHSSAVSSRPTRSRSTS